MFAFDGAEYVTGVEEPATSERGGRILADLDTDPIYRELCRAHGTFRARLTPKPWRLPGIRAPRGRWPFPDEDAERRFRHWLAGYENAAAGYAVCRMLAAHGRAPSTSDEQILRRHDERTGVHTRLPLA